MRRPGLGRSNMTAWGYRVYAFNLKHGRDELPLGESDTRQKLGELIRDVQNQKTVKGIPKMRGGADTTTPGAEEKNKNSYQPSTPTMTIKNCEWRTDDHLHLLVSMGEVGLHEDLVDPKSQKRQPILHQSAEVTLRVDIYLPVSGTQAVLVTETHRQRDPVDRLFKWIQYQWKQYTEKRKKANRDEIQQWKESKKRSEPVGPKPKVEYYTRYYISGTRLGDAELLQEIIETADKGSAEFYELGPNGKKKHSLMRNVTTQAEIGMMGRTLQKVGAGNENLKKTRKETVLELVEGFEYDIESLQQGGIEFKEATLKLHSAKGNVTFKAGQASDVFTYPFKSGRPKDVGYYYVTIAKAQALAPAASIELDDPEDSEVCQWLENEPTRSPLDQPVSTPAQLQSRDSESAESGYGASLQP